MGLITVGPCHCCLVSSSSSAGCKMDCQQCGEMPAGWTFTIPDGLGDISGTWTVYSLYGCHYMFGDDLATFTLDLVDEEWILSASGADGSYGEWEISAFDFLCQCPNTLTPVQSPPSPQQGCVACDGEPNSEQVTWTLDVSGFIDIDVGFGEVPSSFNGTWTFVGSDTGVAFCKWYFVKPGQPYFNATIELYYGLMASSSATVTFSLPYQWPSLDYVGSYSQSVIYGITNLYVGEPLPMFDCCGSSHASLRGDSVIVSRFSAIQRSV